MTSPISRRTKHTEGRAEAPRSPSPSYRATPLYIAAYKISYLSHSDMHTLFPIATLTHIHTLLPRERIIWALCFPIDIGFLGFPMAIYAVKSALLNVCYTGAYPGFSEGGGGLPRSAKEANNPNKRAIELKPRPCAHQGSMFRPY